MFYFGDSSSEALQHRLHHWIAFKLSAQLLRGRPAPRCRSGRCCNCFEFSTDSHRATEDLARSDTDLLERLAAFQHLREGALVRGEINSQFGAVQLPTRRLFDQLAQEFLLRLHRLLDLGDLCLADAAYLRRHWSRYCWLGAFRWLLRSHGFTLRGGCEFFRAAWHRRNAFSRRNVGNDGK